jgi:glycine dehydrogenase subunit 2
MLPELLGRHPLAPASTGQGVMQILFELQEMLKEVIGMRGVSLTPMAGAQGEFAGVAMIRAYHQSRNDNARNEIIVPDAAHGTNPATATMCGCTVREIPSLPNGDIDLEALKAVVGPQTAGIMLTNPSTLGVFERRIGAVAEIVHAAGGMLYYDGANLNAILGKVRPGDMGFDVIHMNLHKTFSTPHGGGGRLGRGRRQRAAAAIHAGAGGRARGRRVSLADEQDRRPSAGCRATPACCCAPSVHAHSGVKGCSACRNCGAQRQLPDGEAAGSRIRTGHRAPRRPRVHRDAAPGRAISTNPMDFVGRLLDHGFHARRRTSRR